MKTHIAVDIALFRLQDSVLQVLLTKRDSQSSAYPNQWSLPGGVVEESDIDLDAAAHRTLVRRIQADVPHMEQVSTEGSATRDFRGWSITTLYFGLVPHDTVLNLPDNAKWFNVTDKQLNNLAFDHSLLVKKAYQRFQTKAVYSLLPAYLMEKTFTYTELQTVYESILDRPIDKSQFRKKLKDHPDLVKVGVRTGVPYNPPVLLSVKLNPTQMLFPESLVKIG